MLRELNGYAIYFDKVAKCRIRIPVAKFHSSPEMLHCVTFLANAHKSMKTLDMSNIVELPGFVQMECIGAFSAALASYGGESLF